jgi:hypothetical protein
MTTAPRRAATVPPEGAKTAQTGDSVSQGCTDAPGAPQRAVEAEGVRGKDFSPLERGKRLVVGGAK